MSEGELIHAVQNVTSKDIALLAHFIQQLHRFRAGGELLPDLIEFYQWLHTKLAFIISREEALRVSLGTVIEKTKKRYSEDMGEYLQNLYSRVKGKNSYLFRLCVTISIKSCRWL